jgi:hypothetical protein
MSQVRLIAIRETLEFFFDSVRLNEKKIRFIDDRKIAK